MSGFTATTYCQISKISDPYIQSVVKVFVQLGGHYYDTLNMATFVILRHPVIILVTDFLNNLTHIESKLNEKQSFLKLIVPLPRFETGSPGSKAGVQTFWPHCSLRTAILCPVTAVPPHVKVIFPPHVQNFCQTKFIYSFYIF